MNVWPGCFTIRPATDAAMNTVAATFARHVRCRRTSFATEPPDALGRGIGHRLLSAPVAICEQCELRQMVAVVGDPANEASTRLDERLRFRWVGVPRDVTHKHGGCKLGVWPGSVLLQRNSGDGSNVPPCRADG